MDNTSRFVSYCLLRCVDEVRDEALNIGVLILDTDANEYSLRVSPNYRRIAQTLPNVSVEHLKRYLPTVIDYFRSQHAAAELTPVGLGELARSWGNVLRLSAVRTISASDSESAAAQLYERFVECGSVASRTDKAAESEQTSSHTSRRLARSIVSRLRHRGFRENRDIEINKEVVGYTSGDTQVPVFFPVAVSGRLLIDTMDMRTRDKQRSLDGARVLAAKAHEVLRASDVLSVSVVLQDSESRELNRVVESLIVEEGTVEKRAPTLYWSHEIDQLVATAPQYQNRLAL